MTSGVFTRSLLKSKSDLTSKNGLENWNFLGCTLNLPGTLHIYLLLPRLQKKPVDFDDELKIGDVRYDNMTKITIKQLFCRLPYEIDDFLKLTTFWTDFPREKYLSWWISLFGRLLSKKRFGFFEIQCKQTFLKQLTNWPISNEFQRGQGVEACPVETIYDSFFIKCFTK